MVLPLSLTKNNTKYKTMKTLITALTFAATVAVGYSAPSVRIRLPERFRVLNDQLFDVRVEATEFGPNSTVSFTINGTPTTFTGTPEVTTNQDSVPDTSSVSTQDKEWTYRSQSIIAPGVHTIVATVVDSDNGGATASYTQKVGVQDFSFTDSRGRAVAKKNYILFIGDAMGTAYRDAGRIVAKSTAGRMREGFFDELQTMDTMPASGMVMTYNSERLVPDSSPTASAWSTGNKTGDGTHGVFADNNDFRLNTNVANLQATKQYGLDNPRIETLWEYLKRKYGYKTGVVSTADICDATPAGEGSHVLSRNLCFDIAKQFVDGIPGFSGGPVFDVFLGGGREHFDAGTVNPTSTTLSSNGRNTLNSGDNRNLTAELVTAGYATAFTRTQLNAIRSGTAPDKLVGLFYSSGNSTDGGATLGNTLVGNTATSGHMNVAFDKLSGGSAKPADEGVADFKGFTDQPMLDEMTDAAIKSLSKNGAPFILMVEGASIDKQSHPNNAIGCIWDVIELDKAVKVGRDFGTTNGTVRNTKTLIVVTADHDQSMSIIGLTDTGATLNSNTNAVLNTRANSLYPRTKTAFDPFIGNTTVAPSSGGNNVNESGGFPDYTDTYSKGVFPNYPGNDNRYRLSVGFRTGNHTGSSVPITADGPGALLFSGYFDQTDVFFKAAKVLGSDTSTLDEALSLRTSKFSTVSPNYGQ